MLMNESNAEICEKDQSQHQVDVNSAHHEENDRTLVKQEVINEAELGESWLSPISKTTTDSANARRSILSGSRESPDSPELSRTTSRTEAVRQDVRRLKSVTLDRMGKMFRARTSAVGRSCLGLDTVSDLNPRGVMFHKRKMNVTKVDDYDEKASRKEKTNSLGRMLNFVDKGGSPRKLFVHPRAGSLSRILRRHPHNEDNGIIDKPTADTGRGIFSRMLSQLRGK
ncbi:uncharacterized protein LOC112466446 [Temnothorax curvispinosus]|uniref:Uncharacterized protein LOC112466446 n=1 Tax=Temnothorax curvispinosus TaxID=300111 RepID=A0A6J1RBM8_9HYME|nr:uncharacterized protein LOC112466446 [Temnothorax curvispinosus]